MKTEFELRGNFNTEEQEIERLRDHIESVQAVPENLKPLLRTILTLPYSTPECRRGFSLNSAVADLRTSLIIFNIVAYRPVARQKPRHKQRENSRCYAAAQ
jgi:hypothetical protein